MVKVRKLAAIVLAVLLAAGSFHEVSYAAETAGDTASSVIIPTDVSAPSDGCILIGLPGSYISDVQNALDRINEIRLEACQEGVINPATNSPLTEDDYVPIKWSYDLEYIARIRAAESALTMQHMRTNGSSCFNISSPNNIRSYGEVIAWNWSSSVITGINQWYGEKADWVAQDDSKVTGHYTQMIDPTHLYVGLGTFCSDYARYYNTTAGEYSSRSGLDESPVSMTGGCIQLLEIKNDYLTGTPEISGDLTGEVDASDALEFLTSVTYSGVGGTLTFSGLPVMSGVSWSSGDPSVASVSDSGVVTGVGCGETSISASVGDTLSAQAQYTVPHIEENLEAVAATCISTGLTAGVRCSVCGEVLTPQEVTPVDKTNHCGEVAVKNASSPDCENDGYTGDEYCSACGDLLTSGQAIPALGHDWGSVSYAWSKDLKGATAMRTCKRDSGHVDSETVSSAVSIIPATCEEDGKIIYTADFSNPAFEDMTTETVLKRTGHSWGEPVYEWSEDYTSVTATLTCSNNPSHKQSETVCTQKNTENEDVILYTASFTNTAFTDQTKEVPVKDIAECTAKLSMDTFVYTGSAIEPSVTVADGTKTLAEGTDYTISYADNTEVGTAEITVSGIGFYKGTLKTSFRIEYLLDPPVLSSVSNISSGVKLTWKANEGADKYRVYRRTFDSSSDTWGSWEEITDTSAVKFTDKTAVSGTEYEYTVRCLAADGTYTSACNPNGLAITFTAAPKISSIKNVKGGVRIAWGEIAGAYKYRVLRKTEGGSWEKAGTTSSASFKDTSVENGTVYTYTVRCMNSSGKYISGYNSTGKTIAYILRPSITGLTSPKTGKMIVRWKENSAATGYQIQYSLDTSFDDIIRTVTVKDEAVTAKAVSKLTSGENYYVRIRTYKKVSGKNYYSAWSPVKNITAK